MSWQVSQQVGHGPLQPEPQEDDQLRIKRCSRHRALCCEAAMHAAPEGATVNAECRHLQHTLAFVTSHDWEGLLHMLVLKAGLNGSLGIAEVRIW